MRIRSRLCWRGECEACTGRIKLPISGKPHADMRRPCSSISASALHHRTYLIQPPQGLTGSWHDVSKLSVLGGRSDYLLQSWTARTS
jgi:hypothetical protein